MRMIVFIMHSGGPGCTDLCPQGSDLHQHVAQNIVWVPPEGGGGPNHAGI